ncbi:MAG: hypothetical protein AAB929_01005 [Patescibacteria group bacterium]
MLTRDDLQAIQQIVKVEVKKEIKNGLSVGLKPIYKELRKLRKDLNITITSFDNEIIDTRRRVDRIEDHLDLPPLQAN